MGMSLSTNNEFDNQLADLESLLSSRFENGKTWVLTVLNAFIFQEPYVFCLYCLCNVA